MPKIGVGICGRKRGEIAQKCANYKEMVSDGSSYSTDTTKLWAFDRALKKLNIFLFKY
jgi:hypothetical protein